MKLSPELEPVRAADFPRDYPVLVLIRIRFPDYSATCSGRVFNVVASLSHGHHPLQSWYVTGVGRGLYWSQILDHVVRPGLGEPVSVDVYHLEPGARVE